MGKYINYEEARKTDFKNINWTKIANKLKTKSKDDCRNKWFHQILSYLYSGNEFTESEDEELIDQCFFEIFLRNN